jgi:hypothetical protein
MFAHNLRRRWLLMDQEKLASLMDRLANALEEVSAVTEEIQKEFGGMGVQMPSSLGTPEMMRNSVNSIKKVADLMRSVANQSKGGPNDIGGGGLGS